MSDKWELWEVRFFLSDELFKRNDSVSYEKTKPLSLVNGMELVGYATVNKGYLVVRREATDEKGD